MNKFANILLNLCELAGGTGTQSRYGEYVKEGEHNV